MSTLTVVKYSQSQQRGEAFRVHLGLQQAGVLAAQDGLVPSRVRYVDLYQRGVMGASDGPPAQQPPGDWIPFRRRLYPPHVLQTPCGCCGRVPSKHHNIHMGSGEHSAERRAGGCDSSTSALLGCWKHGVQDHSRRASLQVLLM
jgi:hypothetical protein